LKEDCVHSSDGIGFIAMDDEALIFIDETTKCRSYDIPKEEPYQGRLDRIVTTYLDEVTMNSLMASDTTS
jgi:hypothetical protein